uniref:Uncharacterized protein n=1 Tax=Pediastrum duplex TaxID=3105 RepID=A0A2U8GIQ1_PEDDU|nr:hypothetical protein [Pediastrum duplex]
MLCFGSSVALRLCLLLPRLLFGRASSLGVLARPKRKKPKHRCEAKERTEGAKSLRYAKAKAMLRRFGSVRLGCASAKPKHRSTTEKPKKKQRAKVKNQRSKEANDAKKQQQRKKMQRSSR